MPDLDALIRAKLKEINEGAEYGNEQALGELLDVAHAVLELWQDPLGVAARPFPDGKVAQAMWHYDFGRAAGINEALLAVAKALGIQEA